jgi:Tfp pilus assembly protein PilX
MALRHSRESGFVLVTILVLVLVFTISAFYAAGSTRIDTQIVNTVRNERIAFYAAEAGIAEGLMRLGLESATPTTVNGVGTFDPSFKGTFEPDDAQPDWCAQIVFDGSAPTKAGTMVTTPSIQAATSRIAYSTGNTGDPTNLTVRWKRPTPLDQGCGGTPAGAIHEIDGDKVLQIVSTGRSGTARRTVVLDLVMGASGLSSVVLRSDICPGVNAQGGGEVNFPGGIVVNSTCAEAVRTGGSASITAEGAIEVVGAGWDGNVTPEPTTGVDAVPDPLADIPVPVPAGRVQRSASKLTIKNTPSQPLQPGIYVGGIAITGGTVTMNSGVYIMKGGGFSVTSNGDVVMQTGGQGVMIYNTCSSWTGANSCTASSSYGPIFIKNNQFIELSALAKDSPESDDWEGIVFFQERLSREPLSINANAEGDLNGLIYARDAALTLLGSSDLLHSQLLVGSIDIQGTPTISEPDFWVDIGESSGGTATAKAWSDF